jgi:hypothetical protein
VPATSATAFGLQTGTWLALAGNFNMKPKTENQDMKSVYPIYLLAVFLANAALSLLLCAVTLHFAHKYTDQAIHSTNWHEQELQRHH